MNSNKQKSINSIFKFMEQSRLANQFVHDQMDYHDMLEDESILNEAKPSKKNKVVHDSNNHVLDVMFEQHGINI